MIRLLDIVLSSIALLILSPLLIPITIILRLSGEGEVFFIQQRVGKNGKMFGLLKFATMLKNSPNLGTGTVTVKNDPRVLPVGRFLRKTKINELPQLLNILKGDMSVIGPRPQTLRCFNAFPPKSQEAIMKVRPGLSGIGSIVFRNEEDLLDKAEDADRFYDEIIMPYKGELEEWFVSKQGVALYLALIFFTIIIVFTNKIDVNQKIFQTLPQKPRELN
jgi:lipopolysaccharide/colanic/teichoic acid biosynthesis glycosyltransferase